jgi:predicted amidophosphoribosyltransferase
VSESAFIRNQYGLWCPNCQERIDEMWPVSCDCCGYPALDHDTFDGDDEMPSAALNPTPERTNDEQG